MGIFRHKVGSVDAINKFRLDYVVPNDVYIRLGPLHIRTATPIYNQDTGKMPFTVSLIVEGVIRFPIHSILRVHLHFWRLV